MALGKELRMTVRALSKRGCSRRAIARAARVSERPVRYELRREEGRRDRRAKVERASSLEGVIQECCGGIGEGRALNATALHEHLVAEHGYVGRLRSVQRYLRRRPGPGRVRARRRVETAPGAQADWAHAPRMWVGGRQGVYGFVLRLSYSRKNAVVWSERKDTLSWLWVHGQAFSRLKARWRLGGMPVNRIGTADVMAVLLPIWAEKRETARRVRQRISAVMRWAVAQGYREDNPAGDAVFSFVLLGYVPPTHGISDRLPGSAAPPLPHREHPGEQLTDA